MGMKRHGQWEEDDDKKKQEPRPWAFLLCIKYCVCVDLDVICDVWLGPSNFFFSLVPSYV